MKSQILCVLGLSVLSSITFAVGHEVKMLNSGSEGFHGV